jgi:nitrogen-specific signal transduction histidine kinase
MKTAKKETSTKKPSHQDADFFAEFWEESWIYITSVVDVLKEPVLLLDKDLKVLAANQAFYDLFQVKKVDTEGELVYQLGSNQWDIPKLRKLLEEILPQETFFKGFEVTQTFPSVGEKTIVLNARHIYSNNPDRAKLFPNIIMLAMDDITSLMTIANSFTNTKHSNQPGKPLAIRTSKLEKKVSSLEKNINVFAKK